MALSGPTLTVKSENYEVSGYETTGHYVTVLTGGVRQGQVRSKGVYKERGHKQPTGPLTRFSPNSHSELKYHLVLDIT